MGGLGWCQRAKKSSNHQIIKIIKPSFVQLSRRVRLSKTHSSIPGKISVKTSNMLMASEDKLLVRDTNDSTSDLLFRVFQISPF